MRRAAVVAVVALLGCGGGGGGGGGLGTCNPGPTAAMTISATGVSPSAVCVQPGGQVTFRNDDAVPHDVEGDPSCSALNLGTITPNGGTRVATMNAVQTCTFHDSGSFAANTAFQGTVAVNQNQVSGAGY